MVQSPTSRVIARIDGAVGHIVFNNPARHNAVSLDMWEAVPVILDQFAADPALRAVVLSGAGGKAFVAGADISQFEETRSDVLRAQLYEAKTNTAFERIASFEKPTIAMIDGYCIGGGLGIALSCDLRIAAEGSTFGIPASKLGLAYGIEGTHRLVDVVGPAYAKEVFFTARRFTHEEAWRMGLVNRVVPREALEATVKELCDTIAENAPLTVATAKRIVDEGLKVVGEFNVEACEALIERCFASQDYTEGRTAFMEKRKPQFRGE